MRLRPRGLEASVRIQVLRWWRRRSPESKQRRPRLHLGRNRQQILNFISQLVICNQKVLADVDEHLWIVLETVLVEEALEYEILVIVVDLPRE